MFLTRLLLCVGWYLFADTCICSLSQPFLYNFIKKCGYYTDHRPSIP